MNELTNEKKEGREKEGKVRKEKEREDKGEGLEGGREGIRARERENR